MNISNSLMNIELCYSIRISYTTYKNSGCGSRLPLAPRPEALVWSSGREDLDAPLVAVAPALEADALVQPVLDALPELERVGHHAVAAPIGPAKDRLIQHMRGIGTENLRIMRYWPGKSLNQVLAVKIRINQNMRGDTRIRALTYQNSGRGTCFPSYCSFRAAKRVRSVCQRIVREIAIEK